MDRKEVKVKHCAPALRASPGSETVERRTGIWL
jgi:hypothetical protein